MIKKIYNEASDGAGELSRTKSLARSSARSPARSPARSSAKTRESNQPIIILPPFVNEESDVGRNNVEEEEEVRLSGLTEMKAYIDRIDRRLFDRYGTPPRSKKFDS